MEYKIGFNHDDSVPELAPVSPEPKRSNAPRKSIVQVSFPGRGGSLAYYNDRFDLKIGDLVYVDGKLEGKRGRVVDITYNFKIKLSDYKRVIAVVDTDVHGTFHHAGSHLLTFDRSALPHEKIKTWFNAPQEDEEVIVCSDSNTFNLDDLSSLNISPAIAERGIDYYESNKVRYLSIDGAYGCAIVEGTQAYTVEFEYFNGEIGSLVCDCFCTGTCKHEVAVILQLREILELIKKDHAEKWEDSNYFAAVYKGTFYDFALNGKDTGSITL